MGIGVNSCKQSDEPRKRLNKLRSVKVTNLDKLRLSMKRTRLRQGIVLPDEMGKFQQSPNYMKATRCFNARSGSSQPPNPAGDRKSTKGIKRMHSLRKLASLRTRGDANHGNAQLASRGGGGGGDDFVGCEDQLAPAKLKLIRRSGSIKIARVRSIKLSRRRWSKSRLDQASIFMTDDESAQELPTDDMEVTSSYNMRQPTRTLWKMPSLRSRRRRHFDRATCSSALRSSKVSQADRVLGVCESENQLIGHVCPSTYCSIHGHLHDPSPPLKGFISTKRRLLKKQRSSIRLERKLKTEASSSSSSSSSSFRRMKQSMQAASLQEHADPVMCDTQGSNEEIFVEIYARLRGPREAPHAESIQQCSDPVSEAILFDNNKYTNMWKLIYKHLAVPGTEALLNEGDEKGSDCNLNQDHRDENHLDMNQVADGEKLEFNQAEAIEFVQQAVDEILHLDEQSPLYPISPNLVVLNHVGICRTAQGPADPATEELKDIQQANSGAIVPKKEGSTEEKQQPRRQRSKGFEKLRKMIITAKFIKAVEKLRRINPRKPQFLSPEAQSQVEKVQLRHLSMDGRKNTQEWMLDFALQQVIAKLAPAQQRRVGVLVEAFERFTPEMNITPPCDPAKMPPSNNVLEEEDEEERSIALDLDSPTDEIPKQSILQHKVDEIPDAETHAEDYKVDSPCEETNILFDKEKFTNVWHMVYRQFIGNENVNAVSNAEGSASSLARTDASAGIEKKEINQADAIQLVQEAIDELLCLHEQLSEQQPSKSCKVPEQNKTYNEQGQLRSPESTDPATENTSNKDAILGEEQERTDADNQKALQRQTSKPLSKLRKMILSTKFINAMEKLRKIRTCKTEENLSSQVSPGAEKVCLRHLSMDGRRNDQEWMLDYALQQVISKFAPAQQKRVALLTQAFETFTPELEQMSTNFFRIKLQPEDYTASTTKQKNEEDNTEGCPPCCSDNIQKEYKEDPDLKTSHHHSHHEQTLIIDSQEDEHKVNAPRYVLADGKYSKMWQLIYQHVKSNSCANSESQTAEIRAKEDQTFETDDTIDVQTTDATCEELEISQSDAIKLVQEAVDGILQQCSTDIYKDKNDDGRFNILDAEGSPDDNFNEEDNKVGKNAFHGHSKWKRAIICSKFVIAMEKMHKLYTQKKRCHYNPLIPDQEAETVHLRQSLMDERSNSEVWMLDYALRQVIAKLAPVQQQKVAVLIEAFETVGPNAEDTSKEPRCKMSNPSDIVFTAGNDDFKEETSSDSCSKAQGDKNTSVAGESSQSQDSGSNIYLDGQKYSSMWRLIYKHIKSGIPNADAKHIPDAEQISTETDHVYGQESDVETLDEETPCDSDWSSTEDNENPDQNSANTELQQKDAIKLVEEAVNEILQMQVQTCDDQSIDPEEKTREEDQAHEELPRSYSVLSKAILCKKFIKAMEKMKKSKPKVQRNLPQQPDSPAENVHLRAQRMDEKNCEEWMLDHALQQVIGKLAPTQKKKVSMLVEAFEKVNPQPDFRRHQRLNVVAR